MNQTTKICPIYRLQKVISGKYKLRILWDLSGGAKRFGELRISLLTGRPGDQSVAPKVLSRELKELNKLGLVLRTDRGGKIKAVEYSLSALGKSFVPGLKIIRSWSHENLSG